MVVCICRGYQGKWILNIAMHSNQVNQINVSYHPVHDRLLMRVGVANETELRLWFTRRFVPVLWRGLKSIVELDPELKGRGNLDGKQDLMAFKNEQAVAQTNFTQKFEEPKQQPGEHQVILASRLKVKVVGPDRNLLVFSSEQGTAIQLGLNRKLVYSVCKLIHDASEKAQWGLDLSLTNKELTMSGSENENVTLN